MMIDDDSVDTTYSPLFVESREDINQSSSSLNMSGKAKETKTLPASVPLSEMLKLGKLIKTKKELLEVNIEEFLIITKEWSTPLNIQFHVSKEGLGSGSFRDAFIAECSNCAAFPNGQYVIKRYKKSEIDDIAKLFNSLEEHTRKSVEMSTLARNFAKQFPDDALSKFKGFTWKRESVLISVTL